MQNTDTDLEKILYLHIGHEYPSGIRKTDAKFRKQWKARVIWVDT